LWTEQIEVSYLFFWARLVLRTRKPFIIGITGSVGKTTTKEMIAAVLARKEAEAVVGSVVKNITNMTGDRGIPATVLRYSGWPGVYDRKTLIEALRSAIPSACPGSLIRLSQHIVT
jgi:pantothenate kinase